MFSCRLSKVQILMLCEYYRISTFGNICIRFKALPALKVYCLSCQVTMFVGLVYCSHAVEGFKI